MNTRHHLFAVATTLLLTVHAAAQTSLLDRLPINIGGKTSSPALAALSDAQVADGLKEALGKGLQQAVTLLGRENGFLTNAAVRIPMPESLQRVEKSLRAIRQDALADEFIRTMNRAAEEAVPKASTIFAGSLKQMTIADARAVLTGPEDSATQYFRKTTTNELHKAFLPIVKQATEKAGVTSAYKNMMSGAGGNTFGKSFGNTLGAFGVSTDATDVDSYVTRRAIDGLFLKVAEEEKRIRQNPAARTTDLLKQVFGAAK